MFLNWGSGVHGHEFSEPRPQNAMHAIRRNPLYRSAFSTPVQQRSTVNEKTIPISVRPSRPQSEVITSPIEQIVRFQEPESDMSEDGRSLASNDSEATTRRTRRRRQTRGTNTTFHLAHPAPTSLTHRQKLLHVRPKLLLQLQQISTESRPKPCVDVLPSTVVVPRLMKKFPRMFRGKDELGSNDVMIVKSEDYDADDGTLDAQDSDEEGLSGRELMAVICQMPRERSIGKAEIVLADGAVWVAEPVSSGYEFRTVDDRGHEVVARWAKKGTKRRNSTDVSDITQACEFKYTFSIIDPNSRRHPILASINETILRIPDTHTSVSSSSRKYPPMSPVQIPGQLPWPTDPDPLERTTNVTDSRTKLLIQVTGIWLALREGWSPCFRYNDTITFVPRGRNRSVSITQDMSRPPVSTGTPESTQSTFRAVIRRTSARASPLTTTPPQPDQRAIPHRSVSAGSAFMRRTAARRFGATPSTLASDGEGECFMGPPRRAATESFGGSGNSTPLVVGLGSGATTPEDTPTRPQGRPYSHMPSSGLQKGFAAEVDRPSSHSGFSPEAAGRPKHGRWKAFTNFFRRSNAHSN